MFKRIIFFNHFHRGDLFTHKEYIRQIQNTLPHIKYEYWHYNHPKLTLDLNIPLTSLPQVPYTNSFFQTEDTLLINTWINSYPNILSEFNGINLLSLTKSWEQIFIKVNELFKTNLVIYEDIRNYLPRINFNYFDLTGINEFINRTHLRKKVLLCNGKPLSSQSSVMTDFSDMLYDLAVKHSNLDFICTTKFPSTVQNIYFTDDIINDTETHSYNAPWNDREINNCDLNEISYLSTKCNLIIGKSSGPSTFCETYDNIMDENKSFLSFANGLHTMSYGIEKKCKYQIISESSDDEVKSIIERELNEI